MKEKEQLEKIIDDTFGMFLKDKDNPIYINIKKECMSKLLDAGFRKREVDEGKVSEIIRNIQYDCDFAEDVFGKLPEAIAKGDIYKERRSNGSKTPSQTRTLQVADRRRY